MADWQTISTAPKDGTYILGYGVSCSEISGPRTVPEIQVVFWAGGECEHAGDDWWACTGGDDCPTWIRATQWAELQEPPNE